MPAFAESRAQRILLAEDDESLRALLHVTLTRLGYEVLDVEDGAELSARISEGLRRGGMPDLILSDIRMPWTSGLLLLQRLRQSGCLVPVILMTAFGDEATHAEAQRLGALLLDKPFETGDLRQAVKALLGEPANGR